MYAMLLNYYRRTGIDLQRLDASSRSPIQALVSEGKFRLHHLFTMEMVNANSRS
jgi:hypothetical protein